MRKIKLGDLCVVSDGQLKEDADTIIDYIDISSVDNISKSVTGFKTMTFGDAPSRARKRVKKGSILVSTVRPNLNAVAILQEETPNVSVASTGFCILDCKENVDERFVFDFCKSQSFINEMVTQATGASYPAVSDKIVRSALVPEYTYEEQCEISKVLDTVFDIIEKRKEEIQNFDDLIKARFVEMFGFPGMDPFKYGKTKLGSCCEINPKKAKDNRLVDNIEVSFVPMPAVSEKGEMDSSDVRRYGDVKKEFTYFIEGDVLFAKITPCMENGKGAVAKGLKNGIGFGSTEFHVLRPIDGISNPYWIYAITSFKSFRKEAESNMTDSAGQRRTPVSFLENYEVSLPPIELQNQFADFVARTDKSKLLEAQQAGFIAKIR